MKLFVLLLTCACLLLGCAGDVPQADPTIPNGRCYLYENDGFGGGFTITLFDDGSFSYYEGMLSSHIGHGTWALDGDILTLSESEKTGHGGDFRFLNNEEELIYLAAGSLNFIHVQLGDGAVFRLLDPSQTAKEDTGLSIYVAS